MTLSAGRREGDSADMETVHGLKLLRLESALTALRRELHDLPAGLDAGPCVATAATRLLAEVGSTLPDALLEELHVLVGRGDGLSADEARVIVAQLQGWVEGLLPSIRFDAFNDPRDGEQDS